MSWVRALPLRGGSLYVGVGALSVLVGALLTRGGAAAAAAGAVAVAALLCYAIQALGFKALTWWIVGGVIAYPFLRYPPGHSQITFDRIWILGLAGSFFVAAQSSETRSAQTRRVAWWLVAFCAVMVLRGALTHPNRDYAVGLAVDCVVLPAILFFAARRMVRTAGQWQQVLGALTVAGAILGAMATAERIIGFQLATFSGGSITVGADVGRRVSGPYPSDDVLAMALLICLAATLMWIQAAKPARWGAGALPLLLECTGLAFTFFRGAWIAALVVVVVAVGLRPRRYARLLGTVALVLVVAGVLLARAQDNQGLSQRLNNVENVSGRVASFEQAFQLFARHPFDGVGLGQFAAAQTAELPTTVVSNVHAVPFAHNSYLSLLSEGGLLVFIPFIGLTIAIGRMVHRFRRRAGESRYDILIGATVVAASLAYLLMSMEETVITSATASNAFFALLLGACAGRLDAFEGGDESSKPSATPAGG